MKITLRDFITWILIAFIICTMFLCVMHYVNAQEKQEPQAKAVEGSQIKVWQLPTYMRENLQRELDDFNKRFEEKVQAYKKELKTRFTEFKDMPDDVILYLEGGIFITRSDFKKLQEQSRDKLNAKPKKEVKGDDKTIN